MPMSEALDMSYLQLAALKTAPMGKLFGAPTAVKVVRPRRFGSATKPKA
jgi:hypothetical protein